MRGGPPSDGARSSRNATAGCGSWRRRHIDRASPASRALGTPVTRNDSGRAAMRRATVARAAAQSAAPSQAIRGASATDRAETGVL